MNDVSKCYQWAANLQIIADEMLNAGAPTSQLSDHATTLNRMVAEILVDSAHVRLQ